MEKGTYLLIEDQDVDIMIVEKMMGRIRPGLKAIVVRNGKSALDKLKEILSGNKEDFPGFIFLDLIMPLFDGFQFLDAYYREIYPIAPDLSVVVLSSSVHEKDKKKCLGYPFVKEYLLKPFNTNAFEELGV